MIDYETALSLKRGDILHHITLTNADGSSLRCRVNGKVRTWKTNHNFRVPVKYGLKICFYVTNFGIIPNNNEWILS